MLNLAPFCILGTIDCNWMRGVNVPWCFEDIVNVSKRRHKTRPLFSLETTYFPFSISLGNEKLLIRLLMKSYWLVCCCSFSSYILLLIRGIAFCVNAWNNQGLMEPWGLKQSEEWLKRERVVKWTVKNEQRAFCRPAASSCKL